MSEWSISFDDELEKMGYRVGWLHSDIYNVYDPRGNVIGVEKNIRDARTRAHQHHTSEAEDLKLEVQRLRKRIESLRITLWETERDARTALKLLKIKNYENVANMCELIAESVNDALKIDTERE